MENKRTRGRQKIEMKMIQDEDDRLITFSKRRSGIYKKASELCTLCGTEVGLVIFSPSGKPFSFSHPCIESVANKFLNQNPPPNDSTTHLVEAHRRARIHELNQQYNELLSQLEEEKKREVMLKQMKKVSRTQCWWQAPVDELGMHDLERLNVSMGNLQKNVYHRLNEMVIGGASTSSISAANPVQLTHPFAAKTTRTNTSTRPHGYGYGRGFF